MATSTKPQPTRSLMYRCSRSGLGLVPLKDRMACQRLRAKCPIRPRSKPELLFRRLQLLFEVLAYVALVGAVCGSRTTTSHAPFSAEG